MAPISLTFSSAAMNKSLFLALTVILTPIASHAGNFFGPASGRGGSPLPSGTDGIYQAVATGTNLTGLFSWTITGGAQSTDTSNNSWIFFIDGNIMNGSTAANMSDGKISGVLDPNAVLANSAGSSTRNSTSSLAKQLTVIPGNKAGGYFNGKINLKSPTAAFSGKGQLQGTPERVDQYIVFDPNPDGLAKVSVATGNYTIPASPVGVSKFTFRGTRLLTGSLTTQTQASN